MDFPGWGDFRDGAASFVGPLETLPMELLRERVAPAGNEVSQ